MKRNIFIAVLLLFLASLLFSNPAGIDNEPHPYQLKYPPSYGAPPIPKDNPLTEEGIWLGRLLFYDSLLSINGKIACGSCHQQQLSFTDGRTLAVGVFGDTLTRNTMTLINLAWGKYFFWDGRVRKLEDLIKEPIANPKEMGGLSEKELVQRLKHHAHYPELFRKAFPNDSISLRSMSKAISQFLRTIVGELHDSPEDYKNFDNRSPEFKAILTENSMRGAVARVNTMQCYSCHFPARFAAFGGQQLTVYEEDSIFQAPTLINLRFTAPYKHGGQFATLRDVLKLYNDSMVDFILKNPDIKLDLSASEIKFTEYDMEHANEIFEPFVDTTIITNPAFSDPFRQKGFTWYGLKKDIGK